MGKFVAVVVILFIVLVVMGGCPHGCQDDGMTTVCEVKHEMTLTQGMQPVLHCHSVPIDAGK